MGTVKLAGRTKDAVERVEQLARNPSEQLPTSIVRDRETAVVQITSTAVTDGRYPGKRFEFDQETRTFTDPGHVIWVDTLNGEDLTVGTYYIARRYGDLRADSKTVYILISQSMFPRTMHCENGILKEYEIRPAGELFLRDVACCDPSCASGSGIISGSGLLDSDACCANYPAKLCLMFANNIVGANGSVNTTIAGKTITLDWYDSLPSGGIRLSGITPITGRGYYGSKTLNGSLFQWWEEIEEDGCIFYCGYAYAGTDQGFDLRGNLGFMIAIAHLGITTLNSYWLCQPFLINRAQWPLFGQFNAGAIVITEGACGAGSGFDNGIPTACCPSNNTANILTCTVTGKTGFLTTLADTITLVYSDTGTLGGTTPAWYAQVDPLCTVTAYLRFRCSGTSWKMAVVNGSGTILISEASFDAALPPGILGDTCSPFHVSKQADVAGTNTCLAGQTGGALLTVTA